MLHNDTAPDYPIVTDLFVHGHHSLGDALHGLCHRVVRLERLDLERNGLNVCSHQNELLHIASRSHQILRHDLHGILTTQFTHNLDTSQGRHCNIKQTRDKSISTIYVNQFFSFFYHWKEH